MKFPVLFIGAAMLCACASRNKTPNEETKTPKITVEPAQKMALLGGKLRLSDGTLAIRTIHISEGKITAIDEAPAATEEKAIDVKGKTLLPAFIDSHIHITFSTAEAELQGGVAAGVDMGAPPFIWEEASKVRPFRLYPAGQLLTAVGGYPTQGWGSEGYGREIKGVDDAKAAVKEMHQKGALLIKMPLEPSGPLLRPEEQKAIVETAHSLGLKVGSHAMSEEVVRMALTAGVDILVHAPTQRLSDELLNSFCKRKDAAIITSFEAFGVTRGALDNVKRARAAGCQILYGTDLGNGVASGILMGELDDLKTIGMTPAEIIDAATKLPAQYWKMSDLGEIAVGKSASLLAIEGDPYQDISLLENRALVMMEGQLIQGN